MTVLVFRLVIGRAAHRVIGRAYFSSTSRSTGKQKGDTARKACGELASGQRLSSIGARVVRKESRAACVIRRIGHIRGAKDR